MSEVLLSRQAGVAEVILAAPHRNNAIDLTLARQLTAAIAQVAADDDVRVALIRAEGRNFCVGGDVRSFAAHADDLSSYVKTLANSVHQAVAALHRLEIPVVSALQGAVAGAGFGLGFAADLVFLARSARLRLAYTALALSPDCGASWLLPRLAGTRRALELALTNRQVSAEEALAWGLASEVVDDEALTDRARTAARELAAAPTEALKATKRLFRQASGPLGEQLDAEAETIASLAGSPFAQEAVLGFVAR